MIRKGTIAALSALMVLVIASAAFAGGAVKWERTWDEAVASAKARNVPLHVTIHKDG
jgi:hypothetical protein